MLGTLKGRVLVILAVLAVCGWYLFTKGITLGLDLQGGTHLVLEVSDPEGTLTREARMDAAERAEKIIRTRINQFGVAEPIIQRSGEDRIIVELAGIKDEERAKQLIQQTAFLQFQQVTDGSQLQRVLPRIDRAIVETLGPDGLPERAAPEATGSRDELTEMLFGGDTADADTSSADTTAADTTGADTTGADTTAQTAIDETLAQRPLTGLLLQGGQPGTYMVAESDVETLRGYLELPAVQRIIPNDIELRWHHQPQGQGAQLYRTLYVLEEDAIVTGEYLENAIANIDPQYNKTLVVFELNRQGGRHFERFTGNNIGEYMAIVLDNAVYSAPVIQGRISTNGQIDMGNAPLAEAQDLALVLRAGALPAPLDIIEERTVGPSLGQDSIDQGRLAGIIGVLLVIVLMVVYYRFSGVLSVVSLAVYLLLVLGGLAAIGAQLTLPGIAGLVLSLGMAVDANVLIFERIREELAAGRTPRTAMDEGFGHAMSAIVDANLTTLLTALVLFQFGTGPVQGFAVTLSIGIIASFFSAVYVTRTLFMLYVERKRATDQLSI